MIKTPKQEAEELVKMFRDYSWVSCEDGYEITSNIESAKQCAIIAVKKIISASPSLPILSDAGNFVNDIEESTEYWKKVLKKLRVMNLKEQFNYENKHYLMLDAEKCEKIVEDFAIKFASFIDKKYYQHKYDNNKYAKSEDDFNNGKTYNIKQLLEIFKKENEQA
jgi:hypothetical protein